MSDSRYCPGCSWSLTPAFDASAKLDGFVCDTCGYEEDRDGRIVSEGNEDRTKPSRDPDDRDAIRKAAAFCSAVCGCADRTDNGREEAEAALAREQARAKKAYIREGMRIDRKAGRTAIGGIDL